MTSPSSDSPGLSDFGDVLMLNPVTMPLGLALKGAMALFGSDGSDDGSADPGDSEGDQADPETYGGDSADAEAAAGQQLSTQTDTLKSLDTELDTLSKQIIAQNDASKQKLLDLKADVDKELDYITNSGDDNVSKTAAVSQFLQTKASDIAKVITDAAATVAKNQQQLQQLGNQYGQQGPPDTPPGGDQNMPGDPGTPDPGIVPQTDPGTDYGPGSQSPYGQDPGYDSGYGSGTDPASALGQMLPQMASAIPGALGGMNPLGSMGGLGDLGSVIGDAIHGSGGDRTPQSDKPDTGDGKKDKTDDGKKDDQGDQQQKHDQAGQTNDQNQQNGQQGNPQTPPAATPSGTAPPAPPAPTLVKLPDGTNGTATSPAAAAAANAHLGGASIEDAYKAAGITLPPPGTQIKDTLPSLSVAQPGDLAVFKDKYIMLLGGNKVYLDGQVQPVSALAKLTGFVAFCHPPASSTPNVPAAAPAAVVPPVSAATSA